MIPTNLKVGDTFTDGDYMYEVTKVTDNPYYRYESKKITKKDVKNAFVKEEITEPTVKKYTKTEINRMSGANLEKLCDELGLEKGFGGEMKRAIIEKLGL